MQCDDQLGRITIREGPTPLQVVDHQHKLVSEKNWNFVTPIS
jgi:hypothetical protein